MNQPARIKKKAGKEMSCEQIRNNMRFHNWKVISQITVPKLYQIITKHCRTCSHCYDEYVERPQDPAK